MTDDRGPVVEGYLCSPCDELMAVAECPRCGNKNTPLIDRREWEKVKEQTSGVIALKEDVMRALDIDLTALRGELEEAKTSRWLSIAAKEATYRDFGELQESKWRLDDKLATLQATHDKLRAGVENGCPCRDLDLRISGVWGKPLCGEEKCKCRYAREDGSHYPGLEDCKWSIHTLLRDGGGS